MPVCCELIAPSLGQQERGGTTYDRYLTAVAERIEDAGHGIVVRRNGSYALVRPDNGAPPTIRVEIPDQAELLQVARDLHKRGEPYDGSMWGWPLRYTPSTEGEPVSAPEWVSDEDEEFGPIQAARLEIGIPGVWRAVLAWWDHEPVVWVERTRECG